MIGCKGEDVYVLWKTTHSNFQQTIKHRQMDTHGHYLVRKDAVNT